MSHFILSWINEKKILIALLIIITAAILSAGTIIGTNAYGLPAGEDGISVEGMVHLSHSFNTGYEAIMETDNLVFCFDFPDGWTISRKETGAEHSESTAALPYMEYYDEIVELTNERGVCITYTCYNMEPGLVGNGSALNYTMEYLVEKVAESELNPEKLIVARITECNGTGCPEDSRSSGRVSYAVLPGSREGLQTTDLPGYYGMCSFYYPEPDSLQIKLSEGIVYIGTPYTFIAESPDGRFTQEEETEVLAILESFRLKFYIK